MSKRFSKSNTYRTSDGERLTRAQIETRIREAKKTVIQKQLDEFGYNFCADCGINDRAGIPIDASHNVSVKKCLEDGMAELSYDTDNIPMRCRICHRKHDKTL